MRIGIIGSGGVAQTLGNGFARKGHDVVVGTRDPQAKAADLQAAIPEAKVGTFADAARHGEAIVFCVNGAHAEAAARAAGAENLAGKLVLDTTNPIDGGPDGVHWAKAVQGSCLQTLQKVAPEAKVVKAWNCVPGIEMVDPELPGGPGTQFICGDDEDAKEQAKAVLKDFGWDAIDIGGASMAPYIESAAIMVINHGVRAGRWDWGLKLLSR